MPILYSSAFQGQSFYREDLQALCISFDNQDCIQTSSFLVSLSDQPVLAYFYTYSSLLSFVRSLLSKPTVLTGGVDYLSCRSVSIRYLLLLFLFYIGALSCKSILAVSSYDYHKIRSHLPSPLRKKVIFSPHSVARAYAIASRARVVKDTLTLQGLTVCWQGSSENPYRKGVDRAIRLYNCLHLQGVFAPLTIVGAHGAGTAFIRSVIHSSARPDLFNLTDFVTEIELESLFLSHNYYIQLSRMEGFGLSVAEAVLYGCKIICTNSGGLTTSSGPCALYLDSSTLQLLDSEYFLDPFPIFSAACFPSNSQRLEYAKLLSTDRRASDIRRAFGPPC